jgi:sporulation protein YlmC with PRC-barrel domain
MEVSFGRSVTCKDGSFGKLADVVVDPATMRLTHLITSPPDAEPRLIPIELAEPAGGADVSLRCTLAATEELPSVREYRDLKSSGETADDEEWDHGVEQVLLPYDGAGGLGLGAYDGVDSMSVSYDRVPKGSAELRHASAIVTADGDYLGGVQGFHLADAGQITEVVLDESHFWSRCEIAIPVEAVQALETDTVTVRLSAAEIAELPSTRVRRWF